MSSLSVLLRSLAISPARGSLLKASSLQSRVQNYAGWPQKPKPEIGHGKAFRRIVHFEKEYTVKPLNVTNLAGRDPETGRVVVKGIGGGIKHKYHWIKWVRDGPTEGPPKEEKVIQILKDGCRTADVALVATGDEVKYIIATENMKAGDIIKTSRHLPRIPVRANEGDAYPLGALPVGTLVNNIERIPGEGGFYVHAAGTSASILRKEGDRVIVLMTTKQEFNFDQHCVAVVGRVSNVLHNKTHIGSAQANRWLGNRPRSGLWQRKSGRHGRKIKPPKKQMKIELQPPELEYIKLTMDM